MVDMSPSWSIFFLWEGNDFVNYTKALWRARRGTSGIFKNDNSNNNNVNNNDITLLVM